MATAGEIISLLGRYIGANNDPLQRLSLVSDRLIRASNSRAKDVVVFQVYPGPNNRGFITLPRNYISILGVDAMWTNGICGVPLRVENDWYQYIFSGTGIRNVSWPDGVTAIPGFFTTFASWTTPMKLRFTLDTTETENKIIVKGTLAGVPIYSTDSNNNWIEGVEVAYSSGTVTTTQEFDTPPYAVLKPATIGRVTMSTVDSNNVVTPVAIYDPGETFPRWRRYQVPVCPTQPGTTAVPTTFSCICKRAFTIYYSLNDEVTPSNLTALMNGLDAMRKHDAEDYAREEQLWAKAEKALATESSDDTQGAEGSVQVDDDFGMQYLTESCGYGGLW